jgi:hypothetical protein
MTQPLGVFNYTNEEYHASEGLSRSKLWTYKQLPQKFWYQYMSGEYDGKKSTKAFFMGSLVHTLVLEPHLFDTEYCLKPKLEPMPEAVLLKDVGREQFEQIKVARTEVKARNDALLAEFQEGLTTKAIVSEEDLTIAHAMRNAVMSNQTAVDIMNGAKFEKSIYWRHEPTGLICKARPDIWNGRIVADLKTTQDAGFRGFQMAAYKDGYFLQAAMMYEALKSIGEPFHNFVYICVEKTSPHSVALYMLDDDALQFGLDQFNHLMERIAESYEKNVWPDYGIQKLTIPKYATMEVEGEQN